MVGDSKKRQGFWIAAALLLVVIAVRLRANGDHRNWFDAVSLATAMLPLLLALVKFGGPTEDDLSRHLRALEEQAEADACRYDNMLGNGQCTLDLGYVRQETLGAADEGAQPLGRLATISDYYAELRTGRLVITGEAGAGKTTLALRLSAALMRGDAEGRPVPVRISLSGWNPGKKDFTPWLVDRIHQLLEGKNASRDRVEALVRAGRVLPVLDDLDRMDPPGTPASPSRAAQAVCEINKYRTTGGRAPLILLCRTDVYRRLHERQIELYQAAHVCLRPVSAPDAADYLNRRVGSRTRWEPVVTRLTALPDGVLARALSTPRHVNQAAAVYEERRQDTYEYLRSPNELADAPTSEAVTGTLLREYAPTSLREGDRHLTPRGVDRSLRWLGRLAGALASAGAGQDILLRDLWRLKERRVRIAEAVLALLFLAVTVVLPLRHHPGQVAGYLLILGTLVLFQACRKRLPRPKDFPLLRLSSQRVRHDLLRRFVLRMALPTLLLPVGGLVVGLVVPANMASASGSSDDPAQLGLAVGVCLALLWALTLGPILVATSAAGDEAPDDPRGEIVRDALAGIGYFAVFFLAHVVLAAVTAIYGFGDLFGDAGLYPRVAAAVALYGWSGVSRRYLVFLLVTRGRLPFRLGAFLQRCQEAGILRRSGPAYQFRQLEFQEWLAARQRPSGWRRPIAALRGFAASGTPGFSPADPRASV